MLLIYHMGLQRGEEPVELTTKRGRPVKEKKPRTEKQLANDKAQAARFKKEHDQRKAKKTHKSAPQEEATEQPKEEVQEAIVEEPPKDLLSSPQLPVEEESESEPEIEEETVIIKKKKKKKPRIKRTYVDEPSDDDVSNSESDDVEDSEQALCFGFLPLNNRSRRTDFLPVVFKSLIIHSSFSSETVCQCAGRGFQAGLFSYFCSCKYGCSLSFSISSLWSLTNLIRFSRLSFNPSFSRLSL